MKAGFTLIETMVALFIVMIVCASLSRITILSIRSNSFSETLTYASVLGHEKLVFLVVQDENSPDLKVKWHLDPENPIRCNNMLFYRFWQVNDVSAGKQVLIYVVWDEMMRLEPHNFGSSAEINGSTCRSITMSDIILTE